MDRRTFIKGTVAAGVLVAVPFAFAVESARKGNEVVWIANGNGWKQVHSLLAVKKGDIFVMTWPLRHEALANGMIDPTDGREGVLAIDCVFGGPLVYPPYPWCKRCLDPRIVPEDETADVANECRKVCDLCIADPDRAERKVKACRRHFKLHPLKNHG